MLRDELLFDLADWLTSPPSGSRVQMWAVGAVFAMIVIGAPGADPNSRADAGSSYVVFGSASFGATFNLSLLNGANGFRIHGTSANEVDTCDQC